MDSHISVSAGGTCYSGPEAVDLFRAKVLAGSLRLYFKCGMIPTRGVTMSHMLTMAEQYTGQKYKRRRAECERAESDLRVMIEAQAAIVPIIRS